MQLCNKLSNRTGQKDLGVIRTHKIVTVQTHDFHGKRTMAPHPGKYAQNYAEAPLRRVGIESDCGPSGQE